MPPDPETFPPQQRITFIYTAFIPNPRPPLHKERAIKRPRSFTDQESSPLSLPWVYILLALADVERHGYGIMRDVEERTDGHVNLWPATLYGAIKRMLAAGLIVESTPPTDAESADRRRKYYRLTDRGRTVLGEETGRLAELVEIARQKDVLQTPGTV